MSEPSAYTIPEWPYAWGGPSGTGDIRIIPDDFIVRESLPFIPEGSGEHVYLQVEKSGENTDFVARRLARFAGVRQRDIGFAGLKDRHARSTQWFSLWLPGKEEPDWSEVETANIKIRSAVRHARKLKRGVIAENFFRIRIRNWQGDRIASDEKLRLIETDGFPNYFAEQRFGYSGQNINQALFLLDGKKRKREQQSLYLSALRSYLFNLILAERVRQRNWNKLLNGDICLLRRTHSLFRPDYDDEEVHQRMFGGQIHASGLLWGKDNGPLATMQAGDIENNVFHQFPELTAILTKFDVKAARRSLRVVPEQMAWNFSSNRDLLLEFSLPAGSYATALLREVIVVDTRSSGQ